MTTAKLHLRNPAGKLYVPNEHQRAFHASGAMHRFAVGGVRSGKSLAGCVEALLMALEYPGSVGLIGRWTYRELMSTTWRQFKQIVPRELIYTVRENPNSCYIDLRVGGGKVSRIWGYHLSNISAIQSMELDWAFVDEAAQIPPERVQESWSMLKSRLAGPVGPNRIWAVSNPNGLDFFHSQFVAKELPLHAWFRCPTEGNRSNLPIGYIENQRRSNPQQWVRKMIDAEFVELTGNVLPQFDSDVHVIGRFIPPPHWPYYVSIDPGLADPTAALLYTVSETGVIVFLDELYEVGLTIGQQAEAIKRLVGTRRVEQFIIDPSTKSRSAETGVARIDQYRSAGLPVWPGNHEIDASIALIQQLLLPAEERRHPVTGQPWSPGLLICEPCGNLRREIGGWVWDTRRGKPRGGEDHAIDSCRYACMARPRAAKPLLGNLARPDFVPEGTVLPPRTPITLTPDMPLHVQKIWRRRLGGGHGERQSLPPIGALPGGATVQ